MKFFLAGFLILPAAVLAADTNALPALAPPYGELPPTFWEQHQTPIIIGVFTILAFAFLVLKVMLRPETKVALPPQTVARRALVKLQQQHEDGRLLSEVSQTLRRYLSEAFDLSNHGLTTAEFCAAIETTPQIGAELAEALSGFLRECDVRKFSPVGSTTPINAASRALDLVTLAERRATIKPS